MKAHRANVNKATLDQRNEKRDYEIVCDKCFQFGLDDQVVGDTCWNTPEELPCGGTLYTGPTKNRNPGPDKKRRKAQ